MIPQQRQRDILEVVEQTGAARTIDLAEQYSVTVETIRRDLEMMHREGLLVRTHGGAIARGHPTQVQSTTERQIQRGKEKQALAERAVSLIRPRDIIFLDASSTVYQLAEVLPELELTVVTNSLDVLECLADRADLKLIGTGGHFRSTSRSFIGPVAVATARRYHLQKVFFSGNGIDAQRGVSESSEEEAQLKADLMPLADHTIFLSDESKLCHRAAFFFARANEIDTWITTDPEEPAKIEPFLQHIAHIELVPRPS